MARQSSTFLGIDVVLACVPNVGILLLSKLQSEAEVGYFSAALQLMVPMNLLFHGVALSAFPIMCRSLDEGLLRLSRIAGQLLELLLVVGVPAAVGLFLLSDQALLLLYGEKEFTAASEALRMMAWSLLLTPLSAVLGQVLYASLRERVTLRIALIDALATVLLAGILISQWGLAGAALAALLAKIVDVMQHYLAVSRLLKGIPLLRAYWKPATASIPMAVCLVLMGGLPIALSAVTGVIVYGSVLVVLAVRSIESFGRLKNRLAELRFE